MAIPKGARYKIMGRWEGDDESGVIAYAYDKGEADSLAYEREAESDGLCQTWVEPIRNAKSTVKYVAYGRWEGNTRKFKIGESYSEDRANSMAYDYEAESDGLCQTWVEKKSVEPSSKRNVAKKPAMKKNPTKIATKKTNVKTNDSKVGKIGIVDKSGKIKWVDKAENSSKAEIKSKSKSKSKNTQTKGKVKPKTENKVIKNKVNSKVSNTNSKSKVNAISDKSKKKKRGRGEWIADVSYYVLDGLLGGM